MLEHRRDQKVGRALAIEQEKRYWVALKEQQAAFEEQLSKAYQEADDALSNELAAETAKILANEKATHEKEKTSNRAASEK